MSLDTDIYLLKKNVTSGGSRSRFIFKKKLPIQLKYKKLFFTKAWGSGRGSSGRIILRTLGSKKRVNLNNKIITNYAYRSLNLSFIANFYYLVFKNKTYSLVFLSSGLVTYIQTATSHKLFILTIFRNVFFRKSKKYRNLFYVKPQIDIYRTFFIIKGLPKNQPVSLLEKYPNATIQYARGAGVSAVLLKKDTRTGMSLVRLMSGVKKYFSIYSIGSLGSVSLRNSSKRKINAAGFYSNFGRKPVVRGVAKNPVDHPHGGRTKSIKYQRTP